MENLNSSESRFPSIFVPRPITRSQPKFSAFGSNIQLSHHALIIVTNKTISLHIQTPFFNSNYKVISFQRTQKIPKHHIFTPFSQSLECGIWPGLRRNTNCLYCKYHGRPCGALEEKPHVTPGRASYFSLLQFGYHPFFYLVFTLFLPLLFCPIHICHLL